MSYSGANSQVVGSVIGAAFSDLRTHLQELTELDAVLGDGDLGVTVDLASGAILGLLPPGEGESVGQLLEECARRINSASPSTFGTLLATAFSAAGQAIATQESIGMEDLVGVGQAAIAGVQKRGKAEPGDKTMLDVLVPAVRAFEDAVAAGQGGLAVAHEAVLAAETGMNGTAGMKAKYGRSSWHGDKSIGVRDAGATAIYYLIESLARNSAHLWCGADHHCDAINGSGG